MIKQAFQHAELRDANDNIIQQGAYGKRSALANSTNDGWIDHVMNNLEVLHDTQENDMATKEYADTAAADAAAGLVDSAPGTLDTLAELAAALGDDPNFATTIVNLIDTKCAAAKAEAILTAHPVGSFYESTDPTSPAELFGGTWEEKIPDGELIGTVAAFAGNSLPDGWLLCNGSAVSRTAYVTLFSVIGTMYGTGDGSTTFSLPNLTDRFIQGNGSSGVVKSAGLPNIIGTIRALKIRSTNSADQTGALYGSDFQQVCASDGTQWGWTKLNINAHTYNPIYGNSETVQPPALTMRFAIFAGHSDLYRWIRQS